MTSSCRFVTFTLYMSLCDITIYFTIYLFRLYIDRVIMACFVHVALWHLLYICHFAILLYISLYIYLGYILIEVIMACFVHVALWHLLYICHFAILLYISLYIHLGYIFIEVIMARFVHVASWHLLYVRRIVSFTIHNAMSLRDNYYALLPRDTHIAFYG